MTATGVAVEWVAMVVTLARRPGLKHRNRRVGGYRFHNDGPVRREVEYFIPEFSSHETLPIEDCCVIGAEAGYAGMDCGLLWERNSDPAAITSVASCFQRSLSAPR